MPRRCWRTGSATQNDRTAPQIARCENRTRGSHRVRRVAPSQRRLDRLGAVAGASFHGAHVVDLLARRKRGAAAVAQEGARGAAQRAVSADPARVAAAHRGVWHRGKNPASARAARRHLRQHEYPRPARGRGGPQARRDRPGNSQRDKRPRTGARQNSRQRSAANLAGRFTQKRFAERRVEAAAKIPARLRRSSFRIRTGGERDRRSRARPIARRRGKNHTDSNSSNQAGSR